MRLQSIDYDFGDVRKSGNTLPTKFNTNIELTGAGAEKEILSVSFRYTATYDPDGSYIQLGGIAKFLSEDAKKTADEWSKNKRIMGEGGEAILNAINYNAAMNIILMARVFNLVPPVLLPTLKFEAVSGAAAPKKK